MYGKKKVVGRDHWYTPHCDGMELANGSSLPCTDVFLNNPYLGYRMTILSTFSLL